jgi:site-specific recombinase XerD
MASVKGAKPSRFKPRPVPARWGGTLRDIAEEWLATYYSYSPKTRTLYHSAILGSLVPALESAGIEEIDEVRPSHLNTWLGEEFARPRRRARYDGDRPGFISSSSLTRLYSTARSFFRWCVASDYLVASPMEQVKAPKRPEFLRQGFTREEAQRLVRWNGYKGIRALRLRDRAIVLLLLDTGLRAAELLSLTTSSIETRTRAGNVRLVGAEDGSKRIEHWLKVRGKGKKERYVKIGDVTHKAVMAWLRSRLPAPGSDAMFTTIQQTPLNYQALHSMLANLGEFAGVEHCYPHRFRHTAATELYLDSTNIELVRTVLGHSDVTTTGRYLRRVGTHYQEMDYRTPGEWLA